MAAKQNDKQTKTHEDPYTRMNNHEHPWTPMSTWARMSTHELTWIRVFPNTMQLANCLLNRMSHSFWASYFGLLAIYVNFWFNCFFLNWTLILFLCFIFFWFCPAVASRSNSWFLQNMTFNLYKYSYLSFIYLWIYFLFIYLFIQYMYIYTCSVCIYDYMCIYIKVCVYICIYIYMCKFMFIF